MNIAVFPPQELETALATVRALHPDASTARDRFVRAIASMHGVSIDPSALPRLSFAQTAAVITDPVRRKRLVQLALVSSLLAGEFAPAIERAVAQLCDALGLDDSALRAARAMGRAAAPDFSASRSPA